jgi:hypothetical protein
MGKINIDSGQVESFPSMAFKRVGKSATEGPMLARR